MARYNEQDNAMSKPDDPATVESSLRLGSGFEADERDRIVASWGRLTSRLRSFPNAVVDLELSVKERATPSQRTVLEAGIAGNDRLVATSEEADLDKALNEVRDDLVRQLTDAKNRTEPSNRRSLRDTIRDDQ
jgi:ribosome-associated translation inhibitor RaiA